MKKSTLSKLETAAEKMAKENGLKITTIMMEEDSYRIDFEREEKSEQKVGF